MQGELSPEAVPLDLCAVGFVHENPREQSHAVELSTAYETTFGA
jgi:hypothetical protein